MAIALNGASNAATRVMSFPTDRLIGKATRHAHRISPEHNDLADSVRSLVARVAPSDVLHEALETPIPNPPPYWKAAAEQGLQGVHLAESVGGQGFGILELAIVLAEFGYGAVPGPFVPSAIASALIAAHDPDAKLLNDLASGEVIAAYAIDSGLTATRQGDGLVIRGEVRAVPAAAAGVSTGAAGAIDSGEEWVVLDADALEIEPVRSVDPLRPLAHVRANAVEVGDDRVLSNLSRTLARALMSTLLSAECDRRGALGHRHRIGIRQDPRAVRQADRPVPGHQAQVRRDDRRHRAGDRGGMGRRPRHRRGSAKAIRTTALSSSPPRWPRRWHLPPRSAAPRTASRCTAASGSPGSTTPTSTTAARSCWPPASAAPRTTRSRSSTSRPAPECASSTSTSIRRPRSCATRSARKSLALKAIPREDAQHRDRRGRLGAAPPAQAVGPRRQVPIEQIIIAQEFNSGRVRRPADGHRGVDHPVDRRVRHR